MITVTPALTRGLHTRTRYNVGTAKIDLAPAPVVSSHVRDWDFDGTAPVVSGDYATINNVDGSSRKLWRVVSVQQTVATPITVRVKLAAEHLPSPASDDFSLRIYGSYNAAGGTTDVLARVRFPPGTYVETQFTVTITPTAPISYTYCDLFATGKGGKITVRDLEIIQDNGAVVRAGEWVSDPIDLARPSTQPVSGSNGIAPLHLGFYYGDIANVDNLNSVAHAKAILAAFDMLICSEPGELSSRQWEVVQSLMVRGVRVYGYTHLAGAGAPPKSDAELNAIVDRCAATGYAGVFYDEAGYAAGTGYVTRARFNTHVNYAHSRGMKVVANSWFPRDILANDVNAEFNPTGTTTALTAGDWVLHESFYTRGDDQYAGVPEGGFAVSMKKYLDTRDMARALGVKVAALAYHMSQVPITDTSDRDRSYMLALMLDVEAWAYGSTTPNNLVQWRTKPSGAFVGTAWRTGPTQVSQIRWERESDAAIVSFEAEDSPPQRVALVLPQMGAVAVSSLVLSLTAQQFTAIRTELTWETSSDQKTWSELADTARRFVRVTAVLQS